MEACRLPGEITTAINVLIRTPRLVKDHDAVERLRHGRRMEFPDAGRSILHDLDYSANLVISGKNFRFRLRRVTLDEVVTCHVLYSFWAFARAEPNHISPSAKR